MEFDKSVTKKNLARSFAGECQEGARYQFLAKLALKENYKYLESLLKILAKNEMAHAKVFYDHIIEKSESKVDNIQIEAGFPFKANTLVEGLKSCAENEKYEHVNIYPSFAKIAKDEGFDDIAKSFMLVADVENCHYMQVSELYNKFITKTVYKTKQPIKQKCSNCGNEFVAKDIPKECPLCGMPRGYYMIKLSDN